ncbi:MAG TPA: LuxR C-terminal-related transcriptional regulator [Rugosimonospora sp.]|nr:LuxR C-terminal-related transcriptional regulator [Rugosimonospora sp.]
MVQSGRRLPHSTLLTHLTSQADVTVLAQTATLKGLYALCPMYRPDVALMDVNVLTAPMVEILHHLCTSFPSVEFVVTYTEAAPAVIGAAIKAGITTLVPHSAGPETVLRLIRQRAQAIRPVPPRQVLTERELAVVALMGAGRSVLEMAELLRISPHTVENHKRSIYAKFGVGNQSHAVSRAMSLGLFDVTTGGPEAAADGAGFAEAADGADGAGGVNGGRPELRRDLVQAVPPDPQLASRVLPIVRGPAGRCLDEVCLTLIRNRLPYVLVATIEPLAGDHWAQWNRSQAVALLVDPDADDWDIPAAMGVPAVVVQSSVPDVTTAIDAVLHGAYALVWRGDVARDLPSVLSLVAHGYRVLDAGHVRLLANWMSALINRPAATAPELTARERDILTSIASGHTVRQTARALGIATKTVENTQARLFRKLGTHNRPETLIAAYRLGLIPH